MKKEIKISKLKEVEARTLSRGFQVRRLITKKREGSEKMMLGVAEMNPGCEEHIWSYKDHPVDEVYYIIKGTLTLYCDDKEYDIKEGEACYIPADCAARKMREMNRGTEKVIFVYTLTPPME